MHQDRQKLNGSQLDNSNEITLLDVKNTADAKSTCSDGNAALSLNTRKFSPKSRRDSRASKMSNLKNGESKVIVIDKKLINFNSVKDTPVKKDPLAKDSVKSGLSDHERAKLDRLVMGAPVHERLTLNGTATQSRSYNNSISSRFREPLQGKSVTPSITLKKANIIK